MSRGALTCINRECKSGNTRVYDVDHEGGIKTVRRHICNDCGEKFRTVQEHAVLAGWVRESQA